MPSEVAAIANMNNGISHRFNFLFLATKSPLFMLIAKDIANLPNFLELAQLRRRDHLHRHSSRYSQAPIGSEFSSNTITLYCTERMPLLLDRVPFMPNLPFAAYIRYKN
jgi:hypothetical protein